MPGVGLACFGVVLHGNLVWYCLVWQFGLVCLGMVIWFGMAWYGVASNNEDVSNQEMGCA